METHINLRDVRAFCAVIDQGSITAASKTLGETKGSVSRRIARLESLLGIALIQRVGGRAQATQEGLSYRKRATEALEILDTAQAELSDKDIIPQGHLRITAAQGLANNLHLGGCLGRFMRAYPKVSLEVIMTGDQLSFREEQIDFAFRLAAGQLPDSGHKAILLTSVSLGFAASPEYLKEQGIPQHPGELAQHRLLLPRVFGDGLTVNMQPCSKPQQAQSFELTGHMLCQDTRFLAEAALSGAGITLMPPKVQEPHITAGNLVRVLGDWESAQQGNLYLVYPARPLSPKAEVFKEFVRAEFRDQQW
ncbi:LysR family transcriptional regulator [Amphritea sp. HPY]|uniref:LysR family transcriptional regulator n=1 Tax=Amphritea sp. HPY TaxID=3421652 RepID=UPI003D7D3949